MAYTIHIDYFSESDAIYTQSLSLWPQTCRNICCILIQTSGGINMAKEFEVFYSYQYNDHDKQVIDEALDRMNGKSQGSLLFN